MTFDETLLRCSTRKSILGGSKNWHCLDQRPIVWAEAEDISRDKAEEDVQSENATLLRRVDELISWDCQIRTGVLSPINCRMLFTCSRWRARGRGRGRLKLSFFIVIGLSTGILVASLLKKAVKVKFIIFFCSFHNKGRVLFSPSSQDVQFRFYYLQCLQKAF